MTGLLGIFVVRGITLAVCLAINAAVAVWFDWPRMWLISAGTGSVITTFIFVVADMRRAQRTEP